MFYLLSNPDTLRDKFKPEFSKLITIEEIGDYIQGVSSNQALFMVSELYTSIEGGFESINGLSELVDRIEGHYLYF